MAKIHRAREEIGWLKLVFGILAAIDVSLVVWAASQPGRPWRNGIEAAAPRGDCPVDPHA